MSWSSRFPSKQPPKGILRTKTSRYQFQRKPVVENSIEKNKDELLVFGYACKIFPPDDHSRDIFKGRHLIPWNGDEKLQLTIDRYDARASLHDLSDFSGDSWNTEYDMSEEEARIEQLCDQERYMAMYTDIAQEKLRHEEELRRLHVSIEGGGDAFNQVGFNYDVASENQCNESVVPAAPVKSEEETEKQMEEEKPFMAPSSLAIPPHMEIPPTEKMHAIIEKTAVFVSKQGVQMEIILKAKQANTSQFLFLDFDHYLNPYYKHVLKRMKEGKYTPDLKGEEKEDNNEEDEESDSDDEGGYLHPSLFANAQRSKQEEEAKKERLKAIQKVDPNHPLAKLIEKGKKANALRQYNLMKLATQNHSSGKENSLEPPPLPKFMESANLNSNPSSPLPVRDHDALPRSITPQEAAMVIVPPPPDIQPMVDSVAKQIAEEGDAVEQTMRDREDPLLSFLEPSHELHPYYTFRKTFIREQMKARKRMLQQAQELAAAEEALKQSNPISFSIKGKDAVPKTTLISTRLQLLEEESDHDENEKPDTNIPANSEGQDREGNNVKDTSTKPKDKSKRKFVEISVVEGIKPKPEPEIQAPTPMTQEDKTRLLEQSKRKFSDTPPIIPIPSPSISNFTVVTPDGNTMSIAEFREKQQERRQKAAQMAMEKAKMTVLNTVTEPEPTKKDPASEDIFDSSEEEDVTENIVPISIVQNTSTEKRAKVEKSPKSRSPSVERKSSPPPLSLTKPARTLKDLIVEASKSSSPSIESKRHRSKSRSVERVRSRSRSRTSSPRRRRKSRSKSKERDFVPSYKKNLGSSSYSRSSKYDENTNVPSAYKIENPAFSYGNGSHSWYRRREASPFRRSHKRHRDSCDRDEDTKRHRSSISSSHKTKRKHSKSQKKHKHKKGKSKKKKHKKSSSSDDDNQSSSSDSDRRKQSNGKIRSPASETANREEGELSPSSGHDMNVA